jgi:integrase
MRHTFAVHCLLRWYRSGVDVQAKLPLLSTYMGHVDVISTQVYLTATSELLREASGRFERAYGSLVTPLKGMGDDAR